jgi:hypothetical protein
MKTIVLAALVALTAGSAVVAPPANAASLTITTGDSGWRDNNSGNDRWRDNNWHDNGRHLGRYKHHRNYGMRMRERREVRECEVTTHRYWRHGRRVVETTRDCD